jgi:hypothetical protein
LRVEMIDSPPRTPHAPRKMTQVSRWSPEIAAESWLNSLSGA